MKKILVIPARRHIIEAYTEYIFRYLGSEFHFEMGYPPMQEHYDTIKENVWNGITSPLEKNPNDFDLIYPHFSTHWFLEPPEKYAKKVAIVALEPGQYSRFREHVAVIGVTSDPLMKENVAKYNLRFGVDTELFRPFKQAKREDLLHVGFIGNVQTPRRYIKELFMQLHGLEGVKLDIYPTGWGKHTRVDEIESMGGQVFLDNIVDGDKWLSGLPNIYNKMDVFIRCDIDHGYQFSVMEAAACGIPVIATDSGMTSELTNAGGGMLIDPGDRSWSQENLSAIAQRIRDAVIYLRDHPLERTAMGDQGRDFVLFNYTWDKFIPTWREFFKEGLENAKM